MNDEPPLIERAADGPLSRQPRFSGQNPQEFFTNILRWVDMAELKIPSYQADSQARDNFLADFWKLEPHLAGVLSSLISIDANRGWSLTGGRNQVMRYSRILHNWMAAPGLYGWRPGAASASLSFYTSDLGAVVELGREGQDGPLRGLFHVDPTQCRLTGNMQAPLEYKGTKNPWREADYMRLTSMPDIREKFKGLGYCFVSRAFELASIMVAVFRHDQEQLGARAPRGLLLLQGISEGQWEQAMQSRAAQLDAQGLKYFNAVAVLASNLDIDAKLIALSQLPAGFDLQTFTSLLMYGYALCAGYDPSEFYPVQFGSLGRGTEMEVQHQKATGKGGLNFVLTLQEQLQRPDVLPETLQFEYEQRDDQGEIAAAGVQKAWVDTYRAIRETGLMQDGGAISKEEMRSLLAEKGIIPREWTEIEEDVEATDTETAERRKGKKEKRRTRDRLLSMPMIWRTIEAFPDEPIYRYAWPAQKADVLWPHAKTLLDTVQVRAFPLKQRADDTVLFEDGEVVITEGDVDKAIEEGKRRLGPEYGSLLDNTPVEA